MPDDQTHWHRVKTGLNWVLELGKRFCSPRMSPRSELLDAHEYGLAPETLAAILDDKELSRAKVE